MTWFFPAARWLVTVAWIVSGVGLATATAVEMKSVWFMPPTPPEVARDITVTNAKDTQGRRASFRILLFSDEFRWRLSWYEATEDGAPFPTFTDEMKAVLDSAHENHLRGRQLRGSAGRRRSQGRPRAGGMAGGAPGRTTSTRS